MKNSNRQKVIKFGPSILQIKDHKNDLGEGQSINFVITHINRLCQNKTVCDFLYFCDINILKLTYLEKPTCHIVLSPPLDPRLLCLVVDQLGYSNCSLVRGTTNNADYYGWRQDNK